MARWVDCVEHTKQLIPLAEMACASPTRCCKFFNKHARVPQSQQPCKARVDNQQLQVHVRCRTRVHRDGPTINRRLTMPTIPQRGSYSMNTRRHQFFIRGGRCRLYTTLSFTRPGPLPWTSPRWNRHFASQHVEGAEAANSSQKRDRLQLVKKMPYRTIHPKKSGTRERFFPCLLRRGVLPSQRELQSGTEMPTWDSMCCAHDIQSFPQTRMWKSIHHALGNDEPS